MTATSDIRRVENELLQVYDFCPPTRTTFASELTPLSRIATKREVDADALGRYLVLNYVPGEQTLFKGVRRVPPGGWRRGPSRLMRSLWAMTTWLLR